MRIEVEVVDKETIKPSSETPHHLKTFSLSGLDQYIPSIYIPYVLFYPATTTEHKAENHLQIHHLKRSLGETLTHIYPLAGRISGNKYVTCNDQGINFFEARVSGDHSLSQFLSNPQPEELNKLFSRHDQLLVLEEKALLSVQANFFKCGGLALAVLISHQFVDGFGFCLFFNLWARIGRGEEKIQPPKLGAASTFPPHNLPHLVIPTATPVEKLVTKRFVFTTANIAAIRANFFPKHHPSRSMTVIALIWRCAINGTASVATLPVDLRRKNLPLLSQNTLGNCGVCTTTSPTAKNHPEFQDLLFKLREAIRMFNSDYVKQLEAGDLMFLQPFGEVNERCSKGEVDRYTFSSVCNFPFYETDFGWGKPVWLTCTIALGYKNFIILMDTKCGTGVEAWITMNEPAMATFERHPDLIDFTSPNNNAADLKSNL